MVRAADVDLLDRLRLAHVRLGRRRLERIQVHHDQLEGQDAVGGQRVHVLGIVVPAEDPAVDLRVQRFQAAFHHFRKAGVGRDVADGDLFGFQVLARSAGAVELDALGDQSPRELGQPALVAHAHDRPLDLRRRHPLPPVVVEKNSVVYAASSRPQHGRPSPRCGTPRNAENSMCTVCSPRGQGPAGWVYDKDFSQIRRDRLGNAATPALFSRVDQSVASGPRSETAALPGGHATA
jgi:hypothetical protein